MLTLKGLQINCLGLICAAEHYDLPDLIQACFHHAKQFIRKQLLFYIFNSPFFRSL